MLKLGSTDINKAYLGSTEINKIYLGVDEVFSGGVVPFTPADIIALGPAFYGKPSEPNTLFADTAGTTPATTTVARENDISGNDRHALQSLASSRPRMDDRPFNGTPSLRMVDTGDRMLLSSELYEVPMGPNTLIVVVEVDTTGFMHIVRGETTGTAWGLRYQSGQNGNLIATHGAGTETLVFAPGAGRYVVGMRRAGADLEVFANGQITLEAVATDVTLTSLKMSDSLVGAIGDTLIFDKYLTNTELNNIGTLFAADYGAIWINLPENGDVITFGDGSTINWGNTVPVEWEN